MLIIILNSIKNLKRRKKIFKNEKKIISVIFFYFKFCKLWHLRFFWKLYTKTSPFLFLFLFFFLPLQRKSKNFFQIKIKIYLLQNIEKKKNISFQMKYVISGFYIYYGKKEKYINVKGISPMKRQIKVLFKAQVLIFWRGKLIWIINSVRFRSSRRYFRKKNINIYNIFIFSLHTLQYFMQKFSLLDRKKMAEK